MRFDELDLSDDVLDAIDAMHFDECTPIQEQAIPIALEGRDLIAVAQTGTGKTAAYLLPVISMLSESDAPTDAINCIVMAPTRELAQQIDRQMEGFAYFVPTSSLAIYGGTDGPEFARQQRGLKMGADVVIATPGRLLAHLSMGYVDLSRVSYFILDEADRMLDMGFYDDIMQIVAKLPRDRQTLMFSATMPPKIQQLAKSILNDPVEVKIAVSRPTDKIDQSAFVCHENQKEGILKHLFTTAHSKRVIVFASSKLKVKELARSLRHSKWRTGEMHSDLDQNTREEVMLDFRAGRIDILIATDILARGIDIDDISMVVNYDVPHEAEDYIHRIGRTARAGAGGKAVTFVSTREQRKFGDIERFLGYEVRKDEVPSDLGKAPDYRPSASSRGGAGRYGGKGRGPKRDSRRGTRRNDGRKRQDVAAKSPAPEHVVAAPHHENAGSVDSKARNGGKSRWRRSRRNRGPGTASTSAAAE